MKNNRVLGKDQRLTITVNEIASELGVSYPQACRVFHKIMNAYGITPDKLPKRGCMFRKYYMDYYNITEDDYREAV